MGGHGGGGHGGGGGRGGGRGGLLLGGVYGVGLYDDDTLDDLDDTPMFIRRRSRLGVIAGESADNGGLTMYTDAGDTGDDSENEPNYNDFGMQSYSGVDNELALSGGGVDPFATASFGVDADDSGDSAPNVGGGKGGGSGTQDVGGFTEDLPDDMSTAEPFDPMSLTEVVDFWYDPLVRSGRTGTLRHPHVDFGQDFCIGLEDSYYSGFNAAPVMGGEMSGMTGKMGA